MRLIQLVFVLAIGSLFMLSSCTNNNKLVYAETQCANPWEHDSDQVIYKNNIQQYLAAHGVNTNQIEVEQYAPIDMIFCAACTCPSGRNITIWVTDADLAEAHSLGFH